MRCLACFFCLVLACGDDDGTIDPDGAVPCTEDAQCDDGIFCNGAERCAPDDAAASALGCVASARACLAGQTCDEAAQMCITLCEGINDADGDGADAIECGGDDCDDADINRFPGNTELCDDDAHDEDCDPDTFGSRDLDRDGFVSAACCNGAICGRDCDDTRATSHPLSVETCDGLDNDCDGTADEEVAIMGFEDLDGDGWGNAAREVVACAGAAGVANQDGDCDDGNVQRNPGLVEVTDTLDNDCDDAIDESTTGVVWYPDVDMDGYGDPFGTSTFASSRPAGDWSLNGEDCDDGNVAVRPAAPELCNGVDDDCNGALDFAIAINDLEDDDGDGVSDLACDGGSDCDDSDPNTAPGLPERCDGRDNDCDGMVDEDVADTPFYVDVDGDGFGKGSSAMMCAATGTFAAQNGDCDDTDATVFPGAPEICDGIAQACGGVIDEGATCSLPSALAGCRAGECVVVRCAGSKLDCNGDPADGCEVDSLTSTTDCGRCGNACSTCTAGVCAGDSQMVWYTFTVNGFWLDSGTPIPNANVNVDLPAAPITTSTGGSFVVEGLGFPPAFATVLFSGVDAYPTLVPVNDTALPYFMTMDEFTALQGMAGPLMAGRGIVALERAHNQDTIVGGGCGPSSEVTTYATLDAPDGSVVEQTIVNGDSDTQLHYYVNVPPGPVSVSLTPGITLGAPIPPVRPGTVSVVKLVGCPF